MRVVQVRNVNEAWARLGETLQGAQREPSRAGEVLAVSEPVTTVYERPTERVLFCPARNANPFFHLMEALWMLAGRADAAFLNHYVADFGGRFAESDGTIHGAYGHRWRYALGYDQLSAVVEKLQTNPRDRQAVIQMWDGMTHHEVTQSGTDNVGDTADGSRIFAGSADLCGHWRDRPCNTHAYLRVREGRIPDEFGFAMDDREQLLDLTVLCRSNDAVWGAYGANAVHFSVLQEYLAARIGVGVGRLYQVSNNFHVYTDFWERVRPSDEQVNDAESVTLGCAPMFTAPHNIDKDVALFMDWHERLWRSGNDIREHHANSWFTDTAVRVARAWHSYRAVRSPDAALSMARAIGCPAWRAACMEWLTRRGAE